MTVQTSSTQRTGSSCSITHELLFKSNISNSEKWLLEVDQTYRWRPSTSRLQPIQKKDDRQQKNLVRERSIFSIPFLFTQGSQGGQIASQLSESSVSQSSCGGMSPESRLTSWSETQSCATGYSTEQSSLYSWRYDEFDRVNTQHVHQLFSDVDELLYEGRLSGSSLGLQKECREWNRHSPHLRILGNQLESPIQEGFQFVLSGAVTSSGRGSEASAQCVNKRESSGEQDPASSLKLCVEGCGLCPTPSSLQEARTPTSPLCKHSSLQQEEVYEEEGKIEEYLAYDAKDLEDEWADQRGARRSVGAGAAGTPGVPPVSAHACIRDAVADEAFDDVWRGVVLSLGELLQKHWQKQTSDGSGHRATLEALGSVLSDPSHVNSKWQSVPLSRSSNTRSLLLVSNGCPSIQASQVPNAFNLNGVMTIQAKPLQQRQQGCTEKSNSDLEDRPNTLWNGRGPAPRVTQSRAASNTPSNRAPCPAQRSIPLPRLTGCSRPSSTYRTTRTRGRAQSCLSQNQSHSPNVPCHQVVRGTRLSQQNNRLLPLLHADQSKLEPSVSTAAPQYMQVPAELILYCQYTLRLVM
uniref:Family with sequence similarity 149 member A n=1 Tax=Esox lucius TaxID=8010 RepID=A0A3P8Y443_ESOLU